MPRSRGHYRVTFGDALEAHEKTIRATGGRKGILSENLVRSAIEVPYSGYYRTIHSKLARLTHSLVKNHGFADGNKRTALQLATLLASRSGYTIVASDRDFVDVILAVAEGTVGFVELTDWFKRNTQKAA